MGGRLSVTRGGGGGNENVTLALPLLRVVVLVGLQSVFIITFLCENIWGVMISFW